MKEPLTLKIAFYLIAFIFGQAIWSLRDADSVLSVVRIASFALLALLSTWGIYKRQRYSQYASAFLLSIWAAQALIFSPYKYRVLLFQALSQQATESDRQLIYPFIFGFVIGIFILVIVISLFRKEVASYFRSDRVAEQFASADTSSGPR